MTQGKLSWAWKRSKKRTSCHFDRGCSTPPTPLISPFASLASPIAPELPGSRLFRDSKGASWWNAEKCPYPNWGLWLGRNWWQIENFLIRRLDADNLCGNRLTLAKQSLQSHSPIPNPFCKASNIWLDSDLKPSCRWLTSVETFTDFYLFTLYQTCFSWVELISQNSNVIVERWKNCGQNPISELKMPENQFLLAWLAWGEPWNYFKQIGTNWVISLQFFSCASDCRELYFLADCQFILAWLKSSPIECAGRRRGNCRQCNDWVVKWSQCVEAAPGKEIGSCLRNETFPPRGKESNVNSVIKNL